MSFIWRIFCCHPEDDEGKQHLLYYVVVNMDHPGLTVTQAWNRTMSFNFNQGTVKSVLYAVVPMVLGELCMDAS